MIVDLRSDTVTQPTDAMRQAMADAAVGDDVYGEDPTANRLEERWAEYLGKEAALFVTSGTLGNQLALAVWGRRGQEVVVDQLSHIALWEAASTAAISGLVPRTLDKGSFGPEDLAPLVGGGAGPATRGSGMVAVEHTHNQRGGTLFPLDQLAELHTFCRHRQLPVHMDGARLLNAATAQDVPVTSITRHVDSVMTCLSKGLSCPIGSILAGPNEMIDDARRLRQIYGGGWRQAGVAAAAGLVALDTMVDRLRDDHRRARQLAVKLAEVPGIEIDLNTVQTNIVIATLEDTGHALDVTTLVAQLHDHDVLAFALDAQSIRFVTHRHITDAHIERAVNAARDCLC
ncbi:MAG: GntG family PLP-dependent aldolase [Acidobacteriota bacterium]